MTITHEQPRKKKAIRHNEYYDMQHVFDNLYAMGENKNHKFYNLIDIISSENNILLAYRNIKSNKGSKTAGTDKKTILNLAKNNTQILIKYVRDRLSNYIPNSVKRVEILKLNGKIRPLGIPTIGDRLIQQCIKQVLEPICEAKFYKHSYGFRPEKSTGHAIARFNQLAYRGYHHVVDIDIKGFFDNVTHAKLLKQLWAMGIRDKSLLKIISKMLKAEIKGIGKPEKGTPQGGILSPLLANIVLNELDWWIASQWENFPTKHKYPVHNGNINSNMFRALKTTNLKDIRIVRFADDFKIMCKDHITAKKIFIAVKQWLNERLHLEISNEKSKITNIRKNYSEFLGFKLKVVKGKKNKYTNRSHMSDKAKSNTFKTFKQKIYDIVKHPVAHKVNTYNATVLGIQNYFCIATMVSKDFYEIAYKVNKNLRCKTRNIRGKKGKISQIYNKVYGKYKFKKMFIAGMITFPIAGVSWRTATIFNPKISRYTPYGRQYIHQKLSLDMGIVRYLMQNPVENKSVEYNDNRISLYTGQLGRCAITKQLLEITYMEVHHKKPIHMGGSDKYDNLIFITSDVHKLIHATIDTTIEKYINRLNLGKSSLEKVNKLRVLAGNDMI